LFSNKKTEKVIDKLEKACELNPKLKNNKIKYRSHDKEEKAIKQGIDKFRKKAAKVKAKGHATKADLDELENIDNETSKAIGIAAAASAFVTITVIGAIDYCKKHKSEPSVVETTGMDAEKLTDGISDCCENAPDADSANFWTKYSLKNTALIKKLATLKGKKPRFTDCCEKEDMIEMVYKMLGV
jgi:hypothetical protein